MYTRLFPYGYVLYGLRIASNRPRPDVTHLATDDWSVINLSVEFMQDEPLPTHYADLDWRLLREGVDPVAKLQVWVAPMPAGIVHRISIHHQEEYLELIATPDAQQQPSRVEVFWHNTSYSPDEQWHNVANWVFDVGLSYIAHLQIPANLHGSALAINGRAIALVGAKGAGKSTLTAALVSAGYAMLTDDHVALWPREEVGERRFWVEPGAPRLRLWPTSLPVLDVAAESLPPIYSFMEKRIKHLETGGDMQRAEFHQSALPLAAIYLLDGRDPDRKEPSVLPLSDKEALFELWSRRYSTVVVSPELATEELATLAQVAQSTRICRLARPDGLGTLLQVIAAIEADLAAM